MATLVLKLDHFCTFVMICQLEHCAFVCISKRFICKSRASGGSSVQRFLLYDHILGCRFSLSSTDFGFVYANSVARQTEEGLPGSGGNSKLTGNPQPRLVLISFVNGPKCCGRGVQCGGASNLRQFRIRGTNSR